MPPHRLPGPGRRRPSDRLSGTPAALPWATTLPVSSITATTAVLNGSVNPEGLACTYWFAWGSTPQYGNTTPSGSAGSGTIPQAVQASLTGLTTGVVYHYAVVASTAAGTVTGADATFTAQAPNPNPTPASVPAPFSVVTETPHLAYPMVIRNVGADVTEQDSLAEVYDCVRLIADCPAGGCRDLPGMGIPDLAFSQGPVNPSPMIDAIKTLEPRAIETPIVNLLDEDPPGGNWQVLLETAVQSGSASQ